MKTKGSKRFKFGQNCSILAVFRRDGVTLCADECEI